MNIFVNALEFKFFFERENDMKFEIKYYLNDSAKRSGIAAFKETIQGDRRYAENWAQNKIKHSNFVAYDIEQK